VRFLSPQPNGPSIRSDDCIRIAGVFFAACTLFHFFDILEPLSSGMPSKRKPLSQTPTPPWGCVPLKKERHSTGVCLNGFFFCVFEDGAAWMDTLDAVQKQALQHRLIT